MFILYFGDNILSEEDTFDIINNKINSTSINKINYPLNTYIIFTNYNIKNLKNTDNDTQCIKENYKFEIKKMINENIKFPSNIINYKYIILVDSTSG